jgi:hypothetical protein
LSEQNKGRKNRGEKGKERKSNLKEKKKTKRKRKKGYICLGVNYLLLLDSDFS